MQTQIIPCDFSLAEHRQAVGTLINTYIQDEHAGGELLSDDGLRQMTDGLAKHPKAIVLLAVGGGEYQGLLVAFENFSTFTAQPMLNIHDVVVRPEVRGRGIGRALLEGIIREAEHRRCNRLTLEVRHDNEPAKHLYASLGFEDTEPPMYYWRKYTRHSALGPQ